MVGTATPALARVPASGGLVMLASVEVTGLGSAEAEHIRVLWAEFVASMPAQASCLLAAPPRIVTKTDMRPRAAYAPDLATLYVKPGDVSRLVVFHELAHHLDFTCGAAEAIGEDLRLAQGIDPSKAWWREGDPVTWPAEYFANAVAEALGEATAHGVRPETVTVVSEWMGVGGAPSESPSPAPVILDHGFSGQPGIV